MEKCPALRGKKIGGGSHFYGCQMLSLGNLIPEFLLSSLISSMPFAPEQQFPQACSSSSCSRAPILLILAISELRETFPSVIPAFQLFLSSTARFSGCSQLRHIPFSSPLHWDTLLPFHYYLPSKLLPSVPRTFSSSLPKSSTEVSLPSVTFSAGPPNSGVQYLLLNSCPDTAAAPCPLPLQLVPSAVLSVVSGARCAHPAPWCSLRNESVNL